MFSAQNSQVSNNVNYIEDVFSTYLYTGNGATQTITNNIDLAGKGGLVWIKCRNTDTTDNAVVDSARGPQNILVTNRTNASGPNDAVDAFTSTGFSLTNDTEYVNANTQTYVSWTFRKQPKLFDIQTWTGNGSNRTIAHNLGSVPGCIIVKRTDSGANWQVYHRANTANPETDYLVLNTTAATADSDTRWNDTLPTSTVFNLGTDATVNASGGTYLAYLFAHNAGGFGLTGTDNVISCGSFTGPNQTVTLGYEPQWILYKDTATAGTSWQIIDNMRGMSLTDSARLFPNSSGAEVTGSQWITPTATGFITGASFASQTFIYVVIRRGPMKVPTLGTSVFAPNIGNNVTTNGLIATAGFPVDVHLEAFNDASTFSTLFFDRLRGDAFYVQSASTAAEATAGARSFANMQGTFYTGSFNFSTMDAIYDFRRAPGFFDVVCYTGTGSATTQAHNLAAIPELMIIKKRNSATNGGWLVGRYISASLVQDGVGLNVPDAFPAARAWSSSNFNSAPTSSIFGIGGFGVINASGDTYVAYLFATLAGVSKVGSYTGTAALQTIACGFTSGARFVLIKRTDSTGDWYVWDSARGITSGNDPYLLLNSTAAEVTSTNYVDTDSTGFKVTAAAPAALNASGGTYLFLAIA
jgi:hypothetical protein